MLIIKDYHKTRKYQDTLISVLTDKTIIIPKTEVTGVRNYNKAFYSFFQKLLAPEPGPAEKSYFTESIISRCVNFSFENEFQLDLLKAIISYWPDYEKQNGNGKHFKIIINRLVKALDHIARVPEHVSYLQNFIYISNKLTNSIAPSSNEMDLYIVRKKVLLIAELLKWHIERIGSHKAIPEEISRLRNIYPEILKFITSEDNK